MFRYSMFKIVESHVSKTAKRGAQRIKTCRRCHSLHSNHMLNRGYAYTTIISSKYHGQTLLSHLASLYPHSTAQAWQQNLNNREVTVNGITADRKRIAHFRPNPCLEPSTLDRTRRSSALRSPV
jgi:hypothetical protein